MTSPVEICNRALSAIGAQSNIASLTENSPEANACALWYDNQRQGLLRAAPWGFARTQVALTQTGSYAAGSAPFPFLYEYLYPTNCIKMRYVLDPASGIYMPSRKNRYLVQAVVDVDQNQSKQLLSNVEGATAVYSLDVTNPDLFDAMFESALTASLAHKICIPVSGNVGIAQAMLQAAEISITNARAADANEAIPTTDHTPDWITGRNSGFGFGGYGGVEGDCNWGTWTASWENMNWGM